MGCSTGGLLAQDTFRITLKFFPTTIPETDPRYTNFESAVRGFLRERLDSWTPGKSGGQVDTVKVVMHGPVQGEEAQKQFNRAVNRLLWGVRTVCGGAAGGGNPAPSGFEVHILELQRNSELPTGPDWTFEDTCSITHQMLVKRKAPVKRKAAAKGKATAKRKASGK